MTIWRWIGFVVFLSVGIALWMGTIPDGVGGVLLIAGALLWAGTLSSQGLGRGGPAPHHSDGGGHWGDGQDIGGDGGGGD